MLATHTRITARPIPIRWRSDLPITAAEAFLRAVSDDYGWIGGYSDGDELRCILPYSMVAKLGMRMVRFRTDTIPLTSDFDVEEERAFLSGVLEHLRSLGADLILPASNTALFRTYPEGAVAAPYGTFVKDLTLTEEELLAEMDAGCRKNIRRAARAGVQVKVSMVYLEPAYDLTKKTMARSGARLKGFGDIQRLAKSLGSQLKVFAAEHQGGMQAALICAFSEHSAYSLYGGTIPQPAQGAMHLLHWEAMRQFRQEGVRRFNFTGVRVDPEPGSKQEGISIFKSRFGGEFLRGYTWKYSFNGLKFGAYSLAMRLAAGGDVVDKEHRKLAEYQA